MSKSSNQTELDTAGPRWQTGNNPQHLLVTIVGDYWIGGLEHIPTATLITLVGKLGVTPDSGRVSLSRLTRRTIMQMQKVGRRTSYRFHDEAIEGAHMVGRTIATYGEATEWSGEWTLCTFSVPDTRADTRRQLRSRLRMLGFAPIYDGVWASPLRRRKAASALLDELGVDNASVFLAFEHVRDGRTPLSTGHDLESIRERLESFANRWHHTVLRLTELSPRESFIARTSITDEYRRFPSIDPNLPDSTLPDEWVASRARARALFHEAYIGMAPSAISYVKSIVAETAPNLAALVHTHLPDDFLRAAPGHVDCTLCYPPAGDE
ncbi:PaaX family transcriptional regulator [Microbacterium sp. A93]|uniref:PaaX family transcriptional regulator n=1 Tax=Microbacterium sp. A93 TaxID=3450716 RepID=UPI003F43E54C